MTEEAFKWAQSLILMGIDRPLVDETPLLVIPVAAPMLIPSIIDILGPGAGVKVLEVVLEEAA